MEIKIKYKPHGWRSYDTPRLKMIEQGDWIDLYTDEDVSICKGEFTIISLGVAMKLPEGTEAHVVPRSSTFKKWGVILANQFGVIDNSYSGNEDYWQAPLYATRDIFIPEHTRLLQFRLMPTMKSMYPDLKLTEVEKLEGPNRGGIGSTGD